MYRSARLRCSRIRVPPLGSTSLHLCQFYMVCPRPNIFNEQLVTSPGYITLHGWYAKSQLSNKNKVMFCLLRSFQPSYTTSYNIWTSSVLRQYSFSPRQILTSRTFSIYSLDSPDLLSGTLQFIYTFFYDATFSRPWSNYFTHNTCVFAFSERQEPVF